MSLKKGDVVENSIWITGEEPPELRKQFEHDVEEAIDYFCYQNDMEHGPVIWTEKHPDDSDVPPVPDHIQGINVRLLVAETTITHKRVQTSIGSFVADLDKKDLELLRGIIRKAAVKQMRGYDDNFGSKITDEDCDQIIEELGPVAAMEAVRKNYKKRLH
jgi:hypothetical protein